MVKAREFASYLIPLAILELYLRAKASRSRNVQLAMTVFLLVVIVYMSIGTIKFANWVWQRT